MTAKLLYEAVLIELNKVNAPSLLLEDFNYLANKAVNQYINKKYNTYDVNQQSTDDLRVLKSTAILEVTSAAHRYTCANNTHKNLSITSTSAPVALENVTLMNSLYGATYEVDLPDDYLHILNCICIYKVNKTYKCYDKDTYVLFGAKRLTADVWGEIINNFYMKPSYKLPYYYIHHVNTSTTLPTNPIEYNGEDASSGVKYGTDWNGKSQTISNGGENVDPDINPEEFSSFIWLIDKRDSPVLLNTVSAWHNVSNQIYPGAQEVLYTIYIGTTKSTLTCTHNGGVFDEPARDLFTNIQKTITINDKTYNIFRFDSGGRLTDTTKFFNFN